MYFAKKNYITFFIFLKKFFIDFPQYLKQKLLSLMALLLKEGRAIYFLV